MEYTVDALEKEAISKIAHAKVLGMIFSAHLSSAPPVAGVAPIRVDIHDAEADESIQSAEWLNLAVFDDADLIIPSVDTVLHTPTEGSLLLGSGTNTILLKTTATGGFACSATCLTPAVTRYMASSADTAGGRIVDCGMIRTLVFP